MAIAAGAVYEVRSLATASNANAGFYVPGGGGTDWSQQNAAQYSLSGLTSSGLGAVILTSSASTDMVNNGMNITAGTNFTTGRYQILSVVAGVSITVDRNCTTGVGAAGVCKIGGALSWQTANDVANTPVVAGNTVYLKNDGAYASYGANNVNFGSAAGSTSLPIRLIGYQSTRGDQPTGTNRPQLTFGNAAFFPGDDWLISNIIFVGGSSSTNGTLCCSGLRNTVMGCKIVNNGTTANAAAYGSTGQYNMCIGNEIISYNGYACYLGSQSILYGNYIHDSAYGYYNTNTGQQSAFVLAGNIFENITNTAINFAGASILDSNILIEGNTFYGGESSSKMGVGVGSAQGASSICAINNIFYGLTTAVNFSVSNTLGISNFNDYFNNTTDITNWVAKGPSDIAVSPAFANTGVYTGTSATTSSHVLTDSGAAFANVVPGRDFLYVSSGTGVTTGVYGITANTSTTITTDNTLGTGTGVTYRIGWGHNLAVGTALVNKSFPPTFATTTTNFSTLGAVQKMPGYPRKSGGTH